VFFLRLKINLIFNYKARELQLIDLSTKCWLKIGISCLKNNLFLNSSKNLVSNYDGLYFPGWIFGFLLFEIFRVKTKSNLMSVRMLIFRLNYLFRTHLSGRELKKVEKHFEQVYQPHYLYDSFVECFLHNVNHSSINFFFIIGECS